MNHRTASHRELRGALVPGALPALLIVFLGALLGACLGSWQRPEKPPLSALWLAAASRPVAVEDLSRLKAAGIEELFVEAARLEEQGGQPRLHALELPAVPPRTRATLVVTGVWENAGGEAETLAEALAGELRRLAHGAEGSGLVPAGFHFDLALPGRGEGSRFYGETLAALRDTLDRSLFLSATLERRWLEGEAAAHLAAGVDFLVPMLYGQRLGEVEDAEAWKLKNVERALGRLEELGRDYLVGVVTSGTAYHLDTRGRATAATYRGTLKPLALSRAFELRYGFSLEAGDRRIYTFEAKGPARFEGWTLERGEAVRVVRLATPHLEEFLRRVRAASPEHHLGQIYYRRPVLDERFSLAQEGLLKALGTQSSEPRLEITLEGERRGRGFALRVALRDLGPGDTDVAYVDSNFLQLTAEGASFGDVDLGGFYRYELLRRDSGGDLRPTLRRPDVLRLFRPIMEDGDEVLSGAIELRPEREDPAVTAGASYLLPGGNEISAEPVTWTP